MKLKIAMLIVTILAIIVIPLILSTQTFSHFDLPKTIALYSIAAVLLLLFSCDRRIVQGSGNLGRYLGLNFIWLLLMALISPSRSLAFFGGYQRYEGFFFFVASGFFFFVGQRLKEYKKQLVLATIITGAVVGAVAAWEFWEGFWSNFQRSCSTIGNPMILGTYFVLVLPGCYGLLFSEKNHSLKLIGYLSLFCIVLGTVFSFSRGGWGGLIITSLLFSVFLGKQFLAEHRTVILTISLVVTCSIATGVLMIYHQPGQLILKNPQRLQSMVRQPVTDPSRLTLLTAAWRVFLERPLTGAGINGLAGSITKHLPATMIASLPKNSTFDLAHSDLVHTLATQGIFGLFIYLGFLFLLVQTWRQWRAEPRRDPLDAALWATLYGYLIVIQFSFPWVGYTFIFWLFTGLLCPMGPVGKAQNRVVTALKICSAGICVLLAWGYGVQAYRADREFHRGYSQRLDPWKYESYLVKAIHYAPWEPEYRFIRAHNAFVIINRKDTTKTQHLRMAKVLTTELFALLEQNPYNYKYYYLLGEVFAFYGKTKQAEEYLYSALKLHPNYYPLYLSLGLVMLQAQKYEAAKGYFNKALAIKGGDYPEARQQLELLRQLPKDADERL